MRFREQLQIINDNINSLVIASELKATLGANYTTIKNSKELGIAISNISEIGFIDNEIQSLKHINYSLESTFERQVDKNQITTLEVIVSKIRLKSEAVKHSLELSLPEQNPNTLIVGLPDYTNFKDVQEFINELDKINKLVFSSKETDSEIKFQNFDSGTSWIEIFFVSSTAITLFGAIVSTAFSCIHRYQIYKENKLRIDSLECAESMRNDVYKIMKDTYLSAIETELKMKIAENEELDSEDFGKLIKAVELITPLLEQGASFQPTLQYSKDNLNTFPSITDLKRIQETLKIDKPTQ